MTKQFERLAYDFDFVAFMLEVNRAAVDMGRRMADVSRETGISHVQLCEMRKGKSSCNARMLMALVAWSGVDPKPFVIDKGDPRVGSAPTDEPTSFTHAVQIIRRLRRELGEARVA